MSEQTKDEQELQQSWDRIDNGPIVTPDDVQAWTTAGLFLLGVLLIVAALR